MKIMKNTPIQAQLMTLQKNYKDDEDGEETHR